MSEDRILVYHGVLGGILILESELKVGRFLWSNALALLLMIVMSLPEYDAKPIFDMTKVTLAATCRVIDVVLPHLELQDLGRVI